MRHPIVHLNGTSREALMDQAERAVSALREAEQALAEAAPNARDYYPAGPGAWEQAREEHWKRVDRLQSVRSEMEALWEGLANEPDVSGRRA